MFSRTQKRKPVASAKNKNRAHPPLKFYEFFAGGGMARAGLGDQWECLFANDFDPKKSDSYIANWGGQHMHVGDVAKVASADLPSRADLAWASFPCQDLSLAGAGAGLEGHRSGTFWPFWDLIRRIGKEGRAPRLVVLENVCGALTSHNGKDFVAIHSALANAGYRAGAIIVDAVNFLPHSRPRLFIIGVENGHPIVEDLMGTGPIKPWHTDGLMQAYSLLSGRARSNWIWWNLSQPKQRQHDFIDLIEDNPQGVTWHTPAETKRLLAMMSEVNLAKVKFVQKSGRRTVGAIYKRTRRDEAGKKVQRAEVRFDNVAGCLRTPSGGSSRQSIIIVEGKNIRSRLLSPREVARLMGLPDSYILPSKYNDAYHLAGDGVAVPFVRYLADNILEPLLTMEKIRAAA
jgi:DNA (cytosine-5)-methyltransferase 1